MPVPVWAWPAMSKAMRAPSFTPSVCARPSSMLMASASPARHWPPEMLLCPGSAALWLRLNSRSTKRLARSSLKPSATTGLPLMATSRPRIIGYQS